MSGSNLFPLKKTVGFDCFSYFLSVKRVLLKTKFFQLKDILRLLDIIPQSLIQQRLHTRRVPEPSPGRRSHLFALRLLVRFWHTGGLLHHRPSILRHYH